MAIEAVRNNDYVIMSIQGWLLCSCSSWKAVSNGGSLSSEEMSAQRFRIFGLRLSNSMWPNMVRCV